MIGLPGAVEMDVVVGAEAEGARRATGDSGPMTTSRATASDPEVPAGLEASFRSSSGPLRVLPGRRGGSVKSRSTGTCHGLGFAFSASLNR